MYKMHRGHDGDSVAELESQFILRLPEEPARVLREAIRTNSTLRDRLSIKIENDMRQGEVRVDQWYLPARIMDLPTIVESLKTIDSKGFYKTADICQMLICKMEDDIVAEEESPQKTKRKDPNKVEKKYLLPHGITPPVKNVRKRRFRKTLKKKYVEAPEIEKEVKRLLRIDNDAVSVKWEVINEDDDKFPNRGGTVVKKEPLDETLEPKDLARDDLLDSFDDLHTAIDIKTEAFDVGVADEHDIFGGAVSDSDEDDGEADDNRFRSKYNNFDIDDNSQLSAGTDSNSVQMKSNVMQSSSMSYDSSLPMRHTRGYDDDDEEDIDDEEDEHESKTSQKFMTQFSSDMFRNDQSTLMMGGISYYGSGSASVDVPVGTTYGDDTSSADGDTPTRSSIETRLAELNVELGELKERRQQQELKIENIENLALKQRFQNILDRLLQEQLEKEQEKYSLEDVLKHQYG